MTRVMARITRYMHLPVEFVPVGLTLRPSAATQLPAALHSLVSPVQLVFSLFVTCRQMFAGSTGNYSVNSIHLSDVASG